MKIFLILISSIFILNQETPCLTNCNLIKVDNGYYKRELLTLGELGPGGEIIEIDTINQKINIKGIAKYYYKSKKKVLVSPILLKNGKRHNQCYSVLLEFEVEPDEDGDFTMSLPINTKFHGFAIYKDITTDEKLTGWVLSPCSND